MKRIKGISLLLIALLSIIRFNAQVKTDTLRFYYGINESDPAIHYSRIDSLVNNLSGRIIKLKIIGYADFLHNSEYNQTLSVTRAEGIKAYLVKTIPPAQINALSVKGLGEQKSVDNGSKEGQAAMRRVDLFVEPFVIMQQDESPKADTMHVDLHTDKLANLEKGESLEINGLNFEPGRHFVVKSSVPVLMNLLKTLRANPKMKIEIQGHICCLKEEGDGMDMDTGIKNLSQSRAKAVYDFLIRNEIDASRLSYKGFGHNKPKVSPEMSPADEQANRRVEVMIIDK